MVKLGHCWTTSTRAGSCNSSGGVHKLLPRVEQQGFGQPHCAWLGSNFIVAIGHAGQADGNAMQVCQDSYTSLAYRCLSTCNSFCLWGCLGRRKQQKAGHHAEQAGSAAMQPQSTLVQPYFSSSSSSVSLLACRPTALPCRPAAAAA